MKSNKPAILVSIAFSLLPNLLYGQDTLQVRSGLKLKRDADSAFAVSCFEKAREFENNDQTDSAILYIDKSLTLCNEAGFLNVAAADYELLATVYESQFNWEETLRNHIRASEAYRKLNDRDNEAEILNTIAGNYFREGVFKKAALYFEQEFSLYQDKNNNKLAFAAEMAGQSYYNLNLDSLSSVWYAGAASLFEQSGDIAGALRSREKLAQLYSRLESYDQALNEYGKIIDRYTQNNDNRNIARAYNQVGFLKFRKKELNGALESFNKAIEFAQRGEKDDFILTDAWSNKAICYQNLQNENEMLACFNKALEFAKNSGRNDEEARIERILAMIFFRKGDNYHAEVYCRSCIESAKLSGNLSVLQLCYRDYSNVLESGNDFIKALEYYEKFLNLRDSLNFEQRLAENKSAAKIVDYEAIEQRIRDEIASKEIQDLEVKNLRAEKQRRENEINLLLKKQELDKSEKERLAASYALEKERLELSIRNQDIVSLRNRQRYDSLTLRQKNIEAAALTTQNQLLETQKKQEAESAQKARQIRNMAVGLGILMGIVAIMVLFGLISTRKKNIKLAESKRHIEKINSDLEKINAEVIKQRDIIELKNQSITDSIQYASRIQTAVLPPIDFLNEWGLENFILFRPKDIVSGDFYWGVKKGGKIIVAAVDCTGHGVPGAFMSMLGHTLLDEIINTREIDNAATILNILRDEIINTLKQKGTTGEARDGMDVSLVILDLNKGKLDFSGANNPLYLIREGKLIKYKADSMPIGIHFISFTPFTNQVIEIRKGDFIYLFSDGYADQFGGAKGKKFMYKPLQDLLVRNSSMSPELQKDMLDKTFLEWKGEREQVDDVMVIGIQI